MFESEQLAEQQWKHGTSPEQLDYLETCPSLFPTNEDLPVTEFTTEAMSAALREMMTQKASGLDDITNEELQLLDDENQHLLLAKINQCWNT